MTRQHPTECQGDSSHSSVILSLVKMTIFSKNSTIAGRKISMEVKFRIEERSNLEKKVTRKISEIKETFSHSNPSNETKQTNILHENSDFEPVNISVNLCDLTL